MLTNDPIYFKPLQPVITIKNTANTSTLYTYSSFTGTATGVTTVFPHGCSVSLSQNTHGEFTISFYDLAEALEAAGVTVGSRVIIECGKQSGSITRLISGLVRKKGYSRGADNRVLYTISGSSTGIRLNELITNQNRSAIKTSVGAVDPTDATMKADALLASVLGFLPTDGILSIINLAANSDIETFIANLLIEYGELQEAVNYIEEQSGGQTVVDTNDLVNFRGEIKNTFFGKGFTIKNKYSGATTDDADDTMYLRRRNWSYEDSFYKSDVYANRAYAILPSESVPTTLEELGFNPSVARAPDAVTSAKEIATKFRPTHSHFLPGDVISNLQILHTVTFNVRLRVCLDAGGLPLNTNGIVANIAYFATDLNLGATNAELAGFQIMGEQQRFLSAAATPLDIQSFDLDTTTDYWLIISTAGVPGGGAALWTQCRQASGTSPYTIGATHTSNFSTNINGGSSWTITSTPPLIGLPRRRSHSFVMHDPKAAQAVQSGLTGGQYTDTLLTDLPTQVKSKESMYRHLSNQLYNIAKPRTTYNFQTVTAPNVPIFPGDPIVISDSVLGLSASSGQVVLTTCGDMTYSWGDMERGNYEAPTILNIQAVGVHAKYT